MSVTIRSESLPPAGSPGRDPAQVLSFKSRKHHRRSIRLKDYDYAQPGAYFVTVCTYRWQHLFGEIVDGAMVLNPLGQAIQEEWLRTVIIRPYVELDEYIVMPNHVHGIIMVKEHGRGTMHRAPTIERFGKPVSGSLPTIVRGFKSASTKRINRLRGTPGQHVWQRNYYEHIIRDERSLNRIRQYIFNNPQQWHVDRYNPDGAGQDEFEDLLKGI